MSPEVITSLVLAISGLITALCIGLRQLHMKHLKCCNAIELDMASSATTDPKKSLDSIV